MCIHNTVNLSVQCRRVIASLFLVIGVVFLSARETFAQPFPLSYLGAGGSQYVLSGKGRSADNVNNAYGTYPIDRLQLGHHGGDAYYSTTFNANGWVFKFTKIAGAPNTSALWQHIGFGWINPNSQGYGEFVPPGMGIGGATGLVASGNQPLTFGFRLGNRLHAPGCPNGLPINGGSLVCAPQPREPLPS
jgi:hypothetical protein